MRRLLEKVRTRWRDSGSLMPSEASDWSAPVLASVLVLAPALLKWLAVDIYPWLLRKISWLWQYDSRAPVPVGFGDAAQFILGAEDPTLRFAFVVGSVCLTVSVAILFVSLGVHLFSDDEHRIKRSGAVARQTLAFILTSGAGVWAFLGFTKP